MRKSAGILAYRNNGLLEIFLVHPGGPFFKNKDEGWWTIPKGEFTDDEDALDAAQREFHEETGYKLKGNFIELKPIKQKGGKMVSAWAIEQNIDALTIVSNTFEIEWPPRSGIKKSFAEVDKAAWFTIEVAKQKINAAQVALLDELVEKL